MLLIRTKETNLDNNTFIFNYIYIKKMYVQYIVHNVEYYTRN